MSEPAPPPAGDGREVEWQFDALDLRPVERWLAALPAHALGGSGLTVTALAKPGRRLVDQYLDTTDWRVGRAGFVLRTRRRGQKDEATLKDTRPADDAGLRTRLEVTEPLPSGGIAALGPEGPVGRRVRAVVGTRALRQVVEVRTRRRPFSLRVGGQEVAELALDDTAVVVGDGQRPVQLRRVEVEVDEAWAERLGPVVTELRRTCGLQPASLSKYEAGLLALGVGVPSLPDLGPTTVSPDATTGELAYAVLRRHTAVVLAKEPGTRLGDDIEELHDMRVATRRLRAAFSLFESVLPLRAGALSEELRWLASVLGAVRDLDVQLEHMGAMDAIAAALDGDATAHPLDEVRALLVEQRRHARGELLAALDSARWDRLVTNLCGLVTAPLPRRAGVRDPATLRVPDLVEARHRATLKAARRARRSGVVADYHRLRIRGKRLRYSLEFTADLYGTRTERFTRQLARLQDHLGLMQDAEVAAVRLRSLAGTGGEPLSPATLFAMGAVAERYRAEAEALFADVPDVVKVLDGRAWHHLRSIMERRREDTPAPAARPRRAPAAPADQDGDLGADVPPPPPPASPADAPDAGATDQAVAVGVATGPSASPLTADAVPPAELDVVVHGPWAATKALDPSESPEAAPSGDQFPGTP